MIFLTLDFETLHDKKYSLKKMPMSLYVQDEQFEVLSCSIKTQDMSEPYFVLGPKKVAKLMKWCREHQDEIVLCCHHSQFDGYIAAHHYGFKPRMHVCTMSMSQQLHSHDGPVSLDNISKLYDAPQPKIKMPDVQGKHWDDLLPEEEDALKVYNNTDVMATEWIAKHQLQHFPKNELWIIDRTIRMFTEGAMVINTEKAKAVMDAEYKTKLGLARQANASQEELRSNDKFAALLESRGFEVPTKWSEKQDKYVPAFAQADLPFQAMRDSDDPELALLVKARLANKTSINETRAKAMLARSNAPVPVYLKAYAAHTMRPGGGDRFNPLNLPRDGRLRECLEAPEGHVFVICDASQIEARDNATFSGQDDLVKAFKEGRDVYSEFASELYGFEVSKETAPTERFVGKTCLGADTKVLTKRGWIEIVNVRFSDKLWDGVEWVNHQGALYAGTKTTIRLSGVTMTPDHEILVGSSNEWMEAQDVLTNEVAFQSALNLAILPSLDMKSITPKQEGTGGGDRYVAANAAVLNTVIMEETSVQGAQLLVTAAPKLKQARSGIGNIKMQCRATSIAPVYSIDYLQRLADATIRTTKRLYTTAREVFQFITYGEKIEPRFWSMYKFSMAGITRSLSWTELTPMGIMNQETSVSAQEATTYPTNEKSKTLKPVYDLLNAGKRKRFTILSDSGPLIVHNSILGLGYQMGAMKFQLTLETGMMGPPIEFSFDQAQQAVNTYRNKYRKIKQTWHELQSRIPFLMPSCKREEHWRGLIFRPGEVVMPNGLSLHYPGLDYEIGRFDSAEFYYTPYDHKYKKRVRNKLYGGLLLENITQCKSWLMTSDHMRQLSRYYKVVLAVYDEIVMCVPISKAEQCLKDTLEIMSIPPAWNENCPLAAEGEISKFYTKP